MPPLVTDHRESLCRAAIPIRDALPRGCARVVHTDLIELDGTGEDQRLILVEGSERPTRCVVAGLAGPIAFGRFPIVNDFGIDAVRCDIRVGDAGYCL